VRAFGSRFVNHENPENASVVSESATFAVIELVTRDDRHEVLARNPRNSWVDSNQNPTYPARSRRCKIGEVDDPGKSACAGCE
jgi:hypothetical protein